ncbi:hypothetical protein QWY86_04935 [Pedobacter aquatilis]|uniref:hypothetical protein n=1 Tax=Pedobacter aquatilis TaxID=351343 RepID=UPI0025B3FFA3|nr:hypothetical protein [Pedobacter aquatilis]MDN3586000.1 hypothetical protein [Pedobacter aquatilis]
MKGLSPWALSALSEIEASMVLYRQEHAEIELKVYLTSDSVWIRISNSNQAPIYFRPCYVPSGKINQFKSRTVDGGVSVRIEAVIGHFLINISLKTLDYAVLQYKCTFTPAYEIFLSFWPRDILLQHSKTQPIKDFGTLHCIQRHTRSGLAYFSKPKSRMRVLYFQNLSSLNDYCQQTNTSLSGVVGGKLPELGLALPPSITKPLRSGKSIVLSDAFICLNTKLNPQSDLAIDYLEMLCEVYKMLPRPTTQYRNWPKILSHGLEDLIYNPGCWTRLNENSYLNAYLCDYQTPPEIMVQLAVLLPLLDYTKWSGVSLPVTEIIKKGLPSFYDEKLKSLVRWHPGAVDMLKGEEEQKVPLVMDSWYLHHPLLNLSRMALDGDKAARKLFLDSIGFAIKVAHKFDYTWPVFYKMDSLEIVKAETEPGKGGETDVAGLYAHVMLKAYELTRSKKYLDEAIRAANRLERVGYDIMYQANNTAFAAGALLKLFKITGNKRYLNISYRCIAAIFQNVQLWECSYGYCKEIPTFFALFPLTDAPYTAAYEEQEVFSALHDYLEQAKDMQILPSIKLLCAEYILYLIHRAPFYYPPMLSPEVLSEEVKTGKLEKGLWIVLEDIQDGNKKSGSVGQEVYGAGNAFGILPRHFITILKNNFMIFIDGPYAIMEKKEKSVRFKMLGSPKMTHILKIVNKDVDGQNTYKGLSFSLHGSDHKENIQMDKDFELTLEGDKMYELHWNRR